MELEKAAIISESGEGGISAKHKELDATIAVITVIQLNVLNSLIFLSIASPFIVLIVVAFEFCRNNYIHFILGVQEKFEWRKTHEGANPALINHVKLIPLSY
jgi:hypothetical protein